MLVKLRGFHTFYMLYGCDNMKKSNINILECEEKQYNQYGYREKSQYSSQDIVLFIDAYNTNVKRSRQSSIFVKPTTVQQLLKQSHIRYVAGNPYVISQSTVVENIQFFNSSKNSYDFRLALNNEDFMIAKKCWGFYINLLETSLRLARETKFKLEAILELEPFQVWVNGCEYRVDSGAFSITGVFYIVFTLTDVKSGKMLSKDEFNLCEKDYNIIPVSKCAFWDENYSSICMSIPEIIAKRVRNFLRQFSKQTFDLCDNAILHNVAVVSNDIKDVNGYFRKLIGKNQYAKASKDIAATDSYKYFAQDKTSLITDYLPEDIDDIVYDTIFLEAIKLNVFAWQGKLLIDGKKVQETTRDHTYVHSMFYSPNATTQIDNLLEYIQTSRRFKMNEEVINLKLSCMKIENQRQGNINSMVLNVLLFFCTLLGSIATLDVLEKRIGFSFEKGLLIAGAVFAFGVVWYIKEYSRKKEVSTIVLNNDF